MIRLNPSSTMLVLVTMPCNSPASITGAIVMGTGPGGGAPRTHYCAAARSSTSSAHWFRLLPASSAASAALR